MLWFEERCWTKRILNAFIALALDISVDVEDDVEVDADVDVDVDVHTCRR